MVEEQSNETSNVRSHSENFLTAQEASASSDGNLLCPITVSSFSYVSKNLKYHSKMSTDVNYYEVINVIVPLINNNVAGNEE